MEKKDELIKLESIKQIRFPRHVSDLIEMKATEKHTCFSEIVRIACMDYLNRNIQDSQLVYASLTDTKRRIGYLETKQDLMAVLVIALARRIIKDLPARDDFSKEITEIEFEKFLDDCTSAAKQTRGSFLDSLAMEVYERSTKEGDN